MTINCIDKSQRRALVFTPMETDWRLLVEAAVAAEDLGYEAVVIPEGWSLDATIVLSEIARQTSRIRVVAGVLSVWGRTAATMAMTAATLDELSDGRFTLGLGASTPLLAEKFHQTPFKASAARLKGTLETARLLLGGERGQDLHGEPGLRLGQNAHPEIPIWVAGLGPRATELAVTAADGWFPVMIPRSEMGHIRSAIAAGSGRGCELISGPITSVTSGGRSGRSGAEQLLGWYLTGMGTLYGDFVAANGYSDEVEALRNANQRPKPGGIDWPAEADPLLEQLTVHGEPEEVAAGLCLWDEQCDLVTIVVGPIPAADLHRHIEASAPALAPVAATV
ncbi:MAG: LLM class flavin-dependent oxidoreductase [Acidimicrobiales bacterium]